MAGRTRPRDVGDLSGGYEEPAAIEVARGRPDQAAEFIERPAADHPGRELTVQLFIGALVELGSRHETGILYRRTHRYLAKRQDSAPRQRSSAYEASVRAGHPGVASSRRQRVQRRYHPRTPSQLNYRMPVRKLHLPRVRVTIPAPFRTSRYDKTTRKFVTGLLSAGMKAVNRSIAQLRAWGDLANADPENWYWCASSVGVRGGCYRVPAAPAPSGEDREMCKERPVIPRATVTAVVHTITLIASDGSVGAFARRAVQDTKAGHS